MKLRKVILNSALVAVSIGLSITAIDFTLGFLANRGFTLEQVSHSPNLIEQRKNIEFNYEFATNSYGLRHTPISKKKAPGSYRVLVVGDSFVEGFGVASEYTFTARLSNYYKAQNVEFINAGLSGQGPSQYQSLIQAFTMKLEVDAILLCLYANDIGDMGLPPGYRWYERALVFVWPNVAGLVKTMKHRMQSQSKDTKDEQVQFVNLVDSIASTKGISQDRISQWKNTMKPEWITAANKNEISAPVLSFGLLQPQFWSESIDVNTPSAEQKWEAMTHTLTEINKFVTSNKKTLGVVYIPSVFQYDSGSFNHERPWPALGSILNESWLTNETEIQKLLRNYMQEENIGFLDLTPYLRERIANSGPLNFHFDEHFNARGHEVTAELIKTWINEQQVYPFIQ